MLLETLPLYLLFEFSVLVASVSERRSAARTSQPVANRAEADLDAGR